MSNANMQNYWSFQHILFIFAGWSWTWGRLKMTMYGQVIKTTAETVNLWVNKQKQSNYICRSVFTLLSGHFNLDSHTMSSNLWPHLKFLLYMCVIIDWIIDWCQTIKTEEATVDWVLHSQRLHCMCSDRHISTTGSYHVPWHSGAAQAGPPDVISQIRPALRVSHWKDPVALVSARSAQHGWRGRF